MKNNNLILATDSYKVSHWMQYPEGTEQVFSYIESRGGVKPSTIFFGLQMFIKNYLEKPVTMEDIDQAQKILDVHLGPGIFNRDGWVRLVEKHNGYLPITIKAVEEGTIVPVKNALVTIVNTDPEFFWITSYLETAMLRDIWYGTTIATVSGYCKKTILEYLKETANGIESIDFALHDFGFRGVSSEQSAEMGGMAHLVNFKGTDTLAALIAAIEYYNASEVPGFSVIAAEHSTSCVNSDPDEQDDFAYIEKMVSILERRVKETGGFAIVAAVADTYNVYRLTREFVGERLKERIVNSGGRLVIRPDSGDPTVVPIEIVEILLEKFGYEMVGKDKQYKLLPPCIRVLQGDGINEDSIRAILESAKQKGISAENFVFGMGGALLQHSNRDTQKFAMKCSAARINGEWKDVFKNPITDPGKMSKKGIIETVRLKTGKIVTKRTSELEEGDIRLMRTVYHNGMLVFDDSFERIRERADVRQLL